MPPVRLSTVCFSCTLKDYALHSTFVGTAAIYLDLWLALIELAAHQTAIIHSLHWVGVVECAVTNSVLEPE